MSQPNSFEAYPGVMREFLGWTGPIGSDLRRRGRTLQFRARMSVGVKSGALRRDIETREATRVDGLEIQVGSWHVKYAAAHHQGARAHVIRARPGGVLRFYWAKAGATVTVQSVNHPGNRANPYLTRWLREAVR